MRSRPLPYSIPNLEAPPSAKPTSAALSIALAAYGLSEQLWGQQHKKINAEEFIAEVARMVDDEIKRTRTNSEQ